MKSLRRQEIFETLRSRFGAEAGGMRALAETGAATPRSASPQAMLHAGLHECLGQGPGDWPSVLGFALSAAARAARERGKPVFILKLKNRAARARTDLWFWARRFRSGSQACHYSERGSREGAAVGR